MKFPHGFTATVERAGGWDRFGNPLPPVTHEITRCARDRKRTLETDGGALVVTTTETLLCDDPAADVHADDVLIFPDGTRWQVDGEVDRPVNPFTGWAPGCEIPIVRASGGNGEQG